MKTKTRLEKLERAKPQGAANVKQFWQEVRASGTRFYIDRVEVDVATYAKEHADYVRHASGSKIPNEIIYYLADEMTV